MNLDEYLAASGFRSDPFASTNADTEDLLQDYFVPPPYFASIIGQPSNPEPHIVFAPRGGGKSAQRRMIEMNSEAADYLCVLHDRFPVSGKTAVLSASLDLHLREIARKVLIAILIHLDDHEGSAKWLDKDDRKHLVKEASFQLGPLSIDDFRHEVQSLKSLGKRAGEWLKEHSGPVKPIIDAVFKKVELEPPDFDIAEHDPAAGPMEPWSYRVKQLVAIAQKLGYESVYVLVDKIDELPETSSDPELAFALVSALVTNLPTMEMDGVAFKVFIWDRARDAYLDNGGRPDRITDFTLGWGVSDLSEMMRRRLSAHSLTSVTSLNELVAPGAGLDFHMLAAEMAHGSPRDMVRLAKAVRDAHLNDSAATGLFSRSNIFDGIGSFSGSIADERSRKYMPDLLKINAYRFTQGRLANDLLRIKKQSAQAKVSEWRKTGLIEKITELQDSRKRPQHLYGVTDTRLAVAMRRDLDSEIVLDTFVVRCPNCDSLNISDDEPTVVCVKCKQEFERAQAASLIADCSIP